MANVWNWRIRGVFSHKIELGMGLASMLHSHLLCLMHMPPFVVNIIEIIFNGTKLRRHYKLMILFSILLIVYSKV